MNHGLNEVRLARLAIRGKLGNLLDRSVIGLGNRKLRIGREAPALRF